MSKQIVKFFQKKKGYSWIQILFSLGVILTGAIGCSSVKIEDFKNEKPILKMEEYFNGTIDAYGVFIDRSGQVKKRFTCEIKASWKDGVGTLDEDFTYSDGTKSRRVWTLKKTKDDEFEGTADDVKGKAIGRVAGNALHWKYTLKLPVDGKVYEVQFDDWMYQMDQNVMLNQSNMSKFGFHLGQVILSFKKRP